MLDWCRCVCKRAGQHQCFDSGLVRPHYFTPGRGTATTQPACLPACLPIHQPPYFATTVSPSFPLCICLSFQPPPPVSPSFPRTTRKARRSLCLTFTPSCRFATPFLSFSIDLETIRSVCRYHRALLTFSTYARTHIPNCTSDTYRYGLPFTVDYIRNLTPCTSETTVSIFNCAPDLSRLIFRLLGGRDVYWILGIFQPPFPPFFLPYGFLPASLFFLLFLSPPLPRYFFSFSGVAILRNWIDSDDRAQRINYNG